MDSDEVKKVLNSEAQNLLNSNLYSKNLGHWGDYSDDEKLKLSELK